MFSGVQVLPFPGLALVLFWSRSKAKLQGFALDTHHACLKLPTSAAVSVVIKGKNIKQCDVKQVLMSVFSRMLIDILQGAISLLPR